MQPPTNHSLPDAEERLEAWLTSQPLAPAPDFVSRTLARIRAESSLIAAAKAGDEAAIDAMLDRWLGESPLESDFEPAQLATQTRRTAHREEESTVAEPLWRRVVIPFPAWARSSVALAAAASVAILAYFSTSGPSVSPIGAGPAGDSDNVNVAQAPDDTLPAPGSEAYDSNALLQLNDSLKDGKVLLNADILSNLPGSDPASDDTAVE